MCHSPVSYRLSELLGMQFVMGADGTNREIDCIHMCLYALDQFNIPRPELDPQWYQTGAMTHLRAMRKWGKRIEKPIYDGDILWCGGLGPTFAIVWDQGILHINQLSKSVNWCPLGNLSNYRTMSILLQPTEQLLDIPI